MVYLNTIIIWLIGLIIFLLGASVSAITHPFDKLNNKSGDYIHIISRYFARIILFTSRVKVQVEGLENINRGEAQLIIANHQSLFDIFVLDAYLPIQFRFFVKKELFSIPILGWCLKIENQIRIDRQSRKKATEGIKKALNLILNGRSIAIFPEGTRSRDGQIKQFKKGGVLVATNAQIPIIPVTINGTFQIMKPKKLLIHPSKVKLIIHPRIKTEGLSRLEMKELSDKIRQIISNGMSKG